MVNETLLLNATSNITNVAQTVTETASSGLLGFDLSGISGTSLAIIGAGIAVGTSGIASAVGAGIVGVTGAKNVAENPKSFSTSLLFQALPQTQGIYGFLIAILILLGVGIIGTPQDVPVAQGLGAIGAGLAVGIAAISAIGQGIAASSGSAAAAEDKKMFGKSILFSVLPETQALYGFIIAILILIGTGIFAGQATGITLSVGWACIGAGLATGIAGISAIGQGIAASGGIAAVSERPKVFGKSILFAALPETQALYGFIIAVLILIGFGALGGATSTLGIAAGIIAVAAGLAVGLAAVSAIGQGLAASSGVGAIAENDKMFGKSILFSVLPETQALYGFLIAVLMLVGSGVIGAVRLGLTTSIGIVALGASIAVGIAGISAIGQGMAASSGIGATSQKSEMFGKSIIFSIIPETQALMGFLIAVLLLIGSGLLGVVRAGISMPIGIISIGAGLAVGLAAVSAIGQGFVVSSSIASVARDAKMFGKGLLFSVLPQTQSLYAFLIAILLLVGGGLVGSVRSGIPLSVGLIAIGAGLAVGLGAISALGQGLAAAAGVSASAEDKKMFGKSVLFSVLPETQALYGFLIAILLLVGGGLVGATKEGLVAASGLVAVGAGLAAGLAAVSAIGQGIAAASGIGAVAEKSKMFGKSVLFSVLPETQALYGFLIAVLLLVGGGILGSVRMGLTTPMGIISLGAGIAVGLAGISAIGQGMAAASGIGATAQKNEMFGKSVIFSVIPETQALMGFLVAILILIGSGLLGAARIGLELPGSMIAIGAGLAVGIAAISALGQGFVVSSSIASVARDAKMFGKGLLFSVLPQTQSLYAFLIAILLLVGGGIVGAARSGMEISTGFIAVGAGLAVGLAAISAMGQGLAASAGVSASTDNKQMFGKSVLFSVLPETQALYGFLIAILLLVGGGLVGATKEGLVAASGLVAVGAGLAVGLAAISAVGQGIAAASGIGAVTEKAKMFGKSVLFSVLPETQALYGIIIAILLMTGVGLLGAVKTGISMVQGIGGVGIGMAMGFAAISAIGQGTVAAASIGASLKSDKSTGKGLVFSVIPETYAIFGLLLAILMMLGLKII